MRQNWYCCEKWQNGGKTRSSYNANICDVTNGILWIFVLYFVTFFKFEKFLNSIFEVNLILSKMSQAAYANKIYADVMRDAKKYVGSWEGKFILQNKTKSE